MTNSLNQRDRITDHRELGEIERNGHQGVAAGEHEMAGIQIEHV
jgi:hypothetical protein